MNKVKLFFISLLFFSFGSLQAQEQLGLRLENYAGINSVLLNPAWQTTNPLAWDLNLVSAGQFVDNSYAYIQNTNLSEVLNNTDNIYTPLDNLDNIPSDALLLDFYTNNRKKYITVSSFITGPSLSVRILEDNYLSIFTNVRTQVSTQDIPSELDYYTAIEQTVNQFFSIPKAQLAVMSWSEVGLSYARKIETYDGYLSIGGSLKFLNGYEAAYAQNATDFQIAQNIADTVTISTPDIRFGYTNSNFDVAEGGNFNLNKNGSGVGLDLGVSYTIEDGEELYKLKLGASILDIGSIRFDRFARDYRVQFPDQLSLTSRDYDGFPTIEEALEVLSQDIYGDPETISTGEEFTIGLPTALSLQADYMIIPMLYVNGLLVQRMPLAKVSVKRGNLLAVTPRFEHRWFAASLPLVLYNYNRFDVGASIRLAFLTVGTDNLGSLMGKSDFTGTDFYVGLKINPFSLGLDWGGGGGGSRGGRGKVKCYNF